MMYAIDTNKAIPRTWFAWYPVTATASNGTVYCIWLEKVQRRRIFFPPMDRHYRYEYTCRGMTLVDTRTRLMGGESGTFC